MSATITRDDWLQALTEAGVVSEQDDQQAVTVTEFAGMFNLPAATAYGRLQKLVRIGKAIETHKRGARVDGKIVTFRAYRLT